MISAFLLVKIFLGNFQLYFANIFKFNFSEIAEPFRGGALSNTEAKPRIKRVFI